MNKYIAAALSALSHVDIKASYKLIRGAKQMKRRPRIKLTYKTWDYKIRCEKHSIPVRVFSPVRERIESLRASQYNIIVFFHGGGWVTGDLNSYERTCRDIARITSHIVVAAEYRLAPEHPFPAALEDCYKVYKEVVRLNRRTDSKRKIILMGDSAGGNLAASLSLYLRDRNELPAYKQVLIYPAAGNNHTEDSPFPSVVENGYNYVLTSKNICDYMDMYIAKESDRNCCYVAPLLAGNFSRQPPTLVITAQYCPLRDEGEEYARKLTEAGNTVVMRRINNTLHGFFMLSARFTAVKQTYTLINEFLKAEVSTDA